MNNKSNKKRGGGLASSSPFIVVFTLLGITVLAGSILSKAPSKAHADVVDDVSVSVSSSCALTASTTEEHKATVDPGITQGDIGKTVLTVACNDINGWAIYAVGYGNDTKGVTDLSMTSAETGTTYTIPTGTSTSGETSSWAMKLTSNGLTPTDAVMTAYQSYHAVPSDWEKVASLAVDTSTSAGSSVETTYRTYATSTQASGDYTGKVKYALVHPSTSCAPGKIMYKGACVEGEIIGDMQDVASWKSSLTTGETVYARDSRDGTIYSVAKLDDGNVWMTSNLDLRLSTDTTLTSDDTNLAVGTSWTPERDMIVGESEDTGCSGWIQSTSEPYSCTFNDPIKGSYYNWTAAIASNDSSDVATDTSISICPAGWRLPKGEVSSGYVGDYAQMLYSEGVIETTTSKAYYPNATAGYAKITSSPIGLYLTGIAAATFGYADAGYYWTSTGDVSGKAYRMKFDSNSVNPQYSYNRVGGCAIRCLADN